MSIASARDWITIAGNIVVLIMVVVLISGIGFACGEKSGTYDGYHHGMEEGYRAGQIDAAGGRMKYRLTTQPTGEVRWIEVPK
jgi:hypothetical protein